ncbi:DNA alkylation repair protein [Terricaulis sp.]|uniref:DNA alkylation repair protein n=1 Tax=Terricaulis sp. TaxID=2768686 RepID=UPI0037847988
MAAAKKTAKKKSPAKANEVKDVLRTLEKKADPQFRRDMSERYGIVVKKAWGVRMANILAIAKSCGTDHALAAALWKSGWYEARLLASMVEDPALVTPAQMDAWCKDFDNWGVVDTVCFKLWDQTPHAWTKIPKWTKSKDEWVKRAGVVLYACVCLHDKGSPDAKFLKLLPLIEKAASDERNFVKKGVSWALRSLGGKKSPKLRAAAREVASRLAASDVAAERWVGKDVLRGLKAS